MRKWTCIRFDEFKATDRLPSPPGVALALMRLTASEAGNVQEIANVLQTDPALVGRAIKLANSALMGVRRPVSSAREAVVRLGMQAVSNLALGFWLVAQSRNLACKRFDYSRYWQYSLAAAAAAKAISVRLKGIAPDEAFTCGLLSQVGRLAMATVYPELYAEILTRCERDGDELLPQLEREQFAIDNVELTVALLEDWGLPTEYVEAVLLQSLGTQKIQDGARTYSLAEALDFGLQLGRACLAPEADRERALRECLNRAERKGIALKALMELADRAMNELRHWGEVLQVPTPPAASFASFAEPPAATVIVQAAPEPSKKDRVEKLTQPAATPASPISAATDPLRVLLMTRDQELLEILSATLTGAGHCVSAASSSEEALPKMLQTLPQMLIIDGLGVAGQGNAWCRQLRQVRLGRDLYVIGLTDSASAAALGGIFDAGADDFLVKPVNAAILAGRLRAGMRIVSLQEDAQRDKEEMRRFAAELAVANRRLHHAAYEDSLTRLPNRRCAMERLAQEWARTARTGHSLACLVCDIDHFKRVNDTFGHDGGDEVLRATADVLRQTIRVSDMAGRLGGEEFLILAPETDMTGARKCGERLCAQVAANRVKLARQEVRVTLSLGIASRDASTQNSDELLKKADNALYQAKQQGRNRVCIA